MRIIDDPLAVALWDGAGRLSPLDRAVRALASVEGVPFAEAADWPVDLRDRALIEARCLSYGQEADVYVTCPQCGEALETVFDLTSLLTAEAGARDGLRPPTSREVAEAVRTGDTISLLGACGGGGEDVEAVEALLEQRFPLIRIALDFECPACGEPFSSRMDPPAYLWADIERHARLVLDEVHVMARAYGWAEADILGMSRTRRAAYLQRIAA